MSYAQNCNFDFNYNYPNGWGQMVQVSLAQLTAPSSSVALIEIADDVNWLSISSPETHTTAWTPNANGYNGIAWAGTYKTGPMGGRAFAAGQDTTNSTLPRHNNGSNFLACDGHVKWLPGNKVSNGFTAQLTTSTQGMVGTVPTAAGTGNMTDGNGNQFTLTFSML